MNLNRNSLVSPGGSAEQYHAFHLVTPSPWPLVCAINALTMILGGVLYMHFFKGGLFIFTWGFLCLVSTMAIWWRDVVREATFEGMHTAIVQTGLRIGVVLFITSEVMFFMAFFWAFFHVSLSPAIELGCVWPPEGIAVFNPWGIPLLNTYILLLSGVTITAAHHFLVGGNVERVHEGFAGTVALAVLFTCFQAFEYFGAGFSIYDGVYGSTFFLATGFHGLHVLIGTCFIVVCWIRFAKGHFTAYHHIGFEAAAWYWHFVDVVWLFLFISIYVWGSGV